MEFLKTFFFHKKKEILLFPIIFLLFFFSYKQYKFYENDFKKVFFYIGPPTFSKTYFEEIQHLHPYAPIYDLSKNYPTDNIAYLKNASDPKDKQYVHELEIMTDYFFYPFLLKKYSLRSILKETFPKGTVILSDTLLKPSEKKILNVDLRINPPQSYKRVNRYQEFAYYIYTVK